ncbi:TatD family hydrolase [Virgibacillus dakarensis]|nr:TatD family hydrolase [Virgibacillus dakarensis]
MENQIIDAHIHLDMYDEPDRNMLLKELKHHHVAALIAVSYHLQSAKMNLEFSRIDKRIKPAFGYHPEQELPSDRMLEEIILFMHRHQQEMVAIGEVGLPYYLRQEKPSIPVEPYMEVLELFIQQAVKLDKPIVLHAVYEDAAIVCDLLEKYSVKKAHFHWFKGDPQTVERMQQNGYYISITPDVLYEKEIQRLVKRYPLANMMVETDGPWTFTGPFTGEKTDPKMIHQSIRKIAELKGLDKEDVYHRLYENTIEFYRLLTV